MTGRTINRIMVFLPNWVGDVVMATPVLREIRQKNFPDAKVAFFGRAVSLAVMAGSSWADVIIEDTSRKKPRLRNFLSTVRAVRQFAPDVTLLLPNSFRSALIARLGRCGRIIGYARSGRTLLLDEKIMPVFSADSPTGFKPMPMLDYYSRLLEPLGMNCVNRTMELPVTPDGEEQACRLLAECGYDAARPLVMLNPGASFGTSKLWPAERFAALADALADEFSAQIIINAAPNPNEQAIAAKVSASMKTRPLVDFASRNNSIASLKSLVKRCALMVTNDTGTRHIAAAFGCGVVTIFGSTDPVWAQIDYPRERIVRVDVPCGPCQKKFCPLPAGPSHHRCVTGVSVDMVLAACRELLGSESVEKRL
ncbi:MAG TPA: lipopolysaccharide heptosyltransferase II [Phycisphaerae bacterium]|nr:lipopolysaccharide heptosyltransferase II [Phycisphaerae bacterium]HPS53726.1 lipopolysaccharide heptosyltransferase II [Phycisphaerae bacterium]